MGAVYKVISIPHCSRTGGGAENVRSSLVDQSGCLTMTFQCMCNGVGGPREYEPGLIPEPTVLG